MTDIAFQEQFLASEDWHRAPWTLFEASLWIETRDSLDVRSVSGPTPNALSVLAQALAKLEVRSSGEIDTHPRTELLTEWLDYEICPRGNSIEVASKRGYPYDTVRDRTLRFGFVDHREPTPEEISAGWDEIVDAINAETPKAVSPPSAASCLYRRVIAGVLVSAEDVRRLWPRTHVPSEAEDAPVNENPSSVLSMQPRSEEAAAAVHASARGLPVPPGMSAAHKFFWKYTGMAFPDLIPEGTTPNFRNDRIRECAAAAGADDLFRNRDKEAVGKALNRFFGKFPQWHRNVA